MSASLPSLPAPQRGRIALSVEALRDQLGGLLREREQLRAKGSRPALERNRRAIVRAQWELSRALLAENAAHSRRAS